MTDFTSNISEPTWNSGGNACFLEKLKDIMNVFFWFRTKLFLVVSSSKWEIFFLFDHHLCSFTEFEWEAAILSVRSQ